MTTDYAIVIAGHGSRDPEAVSEFEQLVELARQRAGGRHVQHGFLEFARPTIDEAARALITSRRPTYCYRSPHLVSRYSRKERSA